MTDWEGARERGSERQRDPGGKVREIARDARLRRGISR